MSRIELAKLIEVDASHALAEVNGQSRRVCITLVPDVEVGDRVVIHRGFVLKRLEEPGAEPAPMGPFEPSN